MPIYLPELDKSDFSFPIVNTALKDPDGLLAFGGDLSPKRLIKAYQQGIFPWFEQEQPILWWSPSQRMVIKPGEMHISRSLKKSLRRAQVKFTINTAFAQVILACAQPRNYSQDTWINIRMQRAYQKLHELGYAHSVEVWQDGILAGGLYGLSIGNIFCGESMFHSCTDASKFAFIALQQHLLSINYQLIDCQLHNPHLESLGAVEVPRNNFIEILQQHAETQPNPEHWHAQDITINLDDIRSNSI